MVAVVDFVVMLNNSHIGCSMILVREGRFGYNVGLVHTEHCGTPKYFAQEVLIVDRIFQR